MGSGPSIKIKQVDGYKSTVDFGQLLPELLVDEPEPIGTGDGPSPEQLLVASVANCLCASLVFALGKYKQEGKASKPRRAVVSSVTRSGV